MVQDQALNLSIGKVREFVEVVRKAPQIQQALAKLQEEIEQTEIEGKAGDSACVVVNGVGEPLRVVISQDAMALDAEALGE